MKRNKRELNNKFYLEFTEILTSAFICGPCGKVVVDKNHEAAFMTETNLNHVQLNNC